MDYPAGVRPKRGRIQIRYTVRGQRYEETLDLRPHATGIAEASKVRRERIRARMYGLTADVQERPFETVAQAYLDASDVRTSTRNSYRDSLNIYWGALARRDIAVITTPDLIAIDDAMTWPSRKTRLNALIPLRQVFRYAVARGYRPDNPASSLHGKRDADRAGPDPYTSDERDTLLRWLREKGRRPAWEYFTLAFYTGMRTGELIGLEWRDLQGDALMVERAYVRRETGPTKTGKRRRVWLLPQAAEVLQMMPRPIQGGRIFVNQYGRGFQSGYHLNRTWRDAHAATKVRLRERAYPWRHTFASLALTAGVRPALVAEQLGHSLQMLLSTYARWIPADDDRAELGKMVAADPKRTQFR